MSAVVWVINNQEQIEKLFERCLEVHQKEFQELGALKVWGHFQAWIQPTFMFRVIVTEDKKLGYNHKLEYDKFPATDSEIIDYIEDFTKDIIKRFGEYLLEEYLKNE